MEKSSTRRADPLADIRYYEMGFLVLFVSNQDIVTLSWLLTLYRRSADRYI